jgi:predicted metalloprotease with PDZ domain
MVVPYTFDDVVAALNAVAPFDWQGFLTERLQSHAGHAPLGGIEHAGYRLVYTGEPTSYEQAWLDNEKKVDAWFSLGLLVFTTGQIDDVRMGSPAFQAGLGPGTKLVAVDGHAFTSEVLKQAIREAKNSPIELIVSTDNEFRTVRLDYHGGEKYPRLERVQDTPDLLDEILKPLAPGKASGL